MMSNSEQDFDHLLSSFLGKAEADADSARLSKEMPIEVSEEELELLQMALDIRRQFAPGKPSAEFIRTTEIRLKNQLRARIKQKDNAAEPNRQRSVPFWQRLLKPIPALASLALVLALTLGSMGVVGASAASLPGDTLYPVKRGWEQARLALTLNPAADAALLASFAQERVEEIEALATMNRPEDLNQAVGDYLALSQQLDDLTENPESGATELTDELANNVEVLQRVLGQVPAEAQPAIQRAIERSMEREQLRQEGEREKPAQSQGQGQGKPEDPPGQNQNQGADQNQRNAEQIANQFAELEITVEGVMAQFEGDCQQDWQCVREQYRVQQQNRRTAQQIARQNNITPEAVMEIFGVCENDWKCVREYYRDERPGGGPPDGVPSND